MNPIDFPQADRSLSAPAGSSDVTPLRIWTDGRECISCWMPTEAERAALAAGEAVYVRCLSGVTQYPLYLEVGSPFEEPRALNQADQAVLHNIGISAASLLMAPWLDLKGNQIFEGDTIRHPDGTQGTVVFLGAEETAIDQWRVDYDDADGTLSRLCLQIGDRGMAEVIR